MSRASGTGRRSRPAAPTTRAPRREAHPTLELGPDGHPFIHTYIGLGLLDEGSISRDAGTWLADYPDDRGDPYLQVRVEANGPAELEEHDLDGRRVATTFGRSLTDAIGRHAFFALAEASPFWIRVAQRHPRAWVAVSIPEIHFSFIPAIAIGGLYIPVPLDRPWVEPTPGPIATRIGLLPTQEPPGPSEATLLRFVAGEEEPREEGVNLVRYQLPGILVVETVAALYAANGPLRSIEWRPFVLPQPVKQVGQLWHSPRPTTLPDGHMLTGFGIIEG